MTGRAWRPTGVGAKNRPRSDTGIYRNRKDDHRGRTRRSRSRMRRVAGKGHLDPVVTGKCNWNFAADRTGGLHLCAVRVLGDRRSWFAPWSLSRHQKRPRCYRNHLIFSTPFPCPVSLARGDTVRGSTGRPDYRPVSGSPSGEWLVGLEYTRYQSGYPPGTSFKTP